MVHATRHQGYLPLLLHPAPESVVEIGLATGISFAPALLYDGVRRAEMVEISPAVIAAAVRFREDNADLAAHPKLTLVVDDGRNHLRYTRQRYDVIVLGLFVPYRPSAGYLFSREFYGICKDRLTAGGFVIQWLPLDQLTPDALRSVMHTFQGVFGDVHAFERDHYLALIGGAPLRFDVDAIAQRMHDPSIASDLTHHGLTDPHGVLASYMMGPAEIAAFAGDAPENTENSLTVEFQRLRIGAYRHAVENLEALLAHRVFPEVGDPGASPESLDRLRRAFEGRTHTLRGAVAQARGRHEDARQHFRRAVQLNPRDVRARAQLKYYEQRRPER
jgi:spermidine synthase